MQALVLIRRGDGAAATGKRFYSDREDCLKGRHKYSSTVISARRVFILQKSVDGNKRSIYNQNKHSKIKTGDYGMIKLLSACSCCGHIFGRSADGTRTELRCPKCGAEMEYCVTGDTVTVRVLRLSEKQKERMGGK